MTAEHVYRASGWRIRSERALPFLWPTTADAADADVAIEFGPLGPLGCGAQALGPFLIHSPDVIDFKRSDVSIRIEAARRIRVDCPPIYDDAELHTYLAGPVFAALAHQRGQPPLHAGALALAHGAIAVVGHSGAGKSTTTRGLMQRGLRLMSDDQLIVDPLTGLAYPAYPSTKLWAASADMLGEDLGPAPRVMPGHDKFHLDAKDSFESAPRPLRMIFVVVPDAEAPELRHRRLTVAEAIPTLSAYVHYRAVAEAIGRREAIFDWAARVAQRAPVVLIRRPLAPGGLPALLDFVLEAAQEVV